MILDLSEDGSLDPRVDEKALGTPGGGLVASEVRDDHRDAGAAHRRALHIGDGDTKADADIPSGMRAVIRTRKKEINELRREVADLRQCERE